MYREQEMVSTGADLLTALNPNVYDEYCSKHGLLYIMFPQLLFQNQTLLSYTEILLCLE